MGPSVVLSANLSNYTIDGNMYVMSLLDNEAHFKPSRTDRSLRIDVGVRIASVTLNELYNHFTLSASYIFWYVIPFWPVVLLSTETGPFRATASIKMREIDPSHVKETSFTCSLVIN